jgi:hypothetical protein
VVVEAMLPVAARAATARTAILVLMDIKYSVRLWAVRCGPQMPFGRRERANGSEARREILPSWIYAFGNNLLQEREVYFRGPRKNPFTSNLSTSSSNSMNLRAP